MSRFVIVGRAGKLRGEGEGCCIKVGVGLICRFFVVVFLGRVAFFGVGGGRDGCGCNGFG